MTKKQCQKNIKQLARNFAKGIEQKANQLLESGAEDLATYQYNMALPKLFVTAAIYALKDAYLPPGPDTLKAFKRKLRNLDRF